MFGQYDMFLKHYDRMLGTGESKLIQDNQVGLISKMIKKQHTAISFPAFSGLFPTVIAAAAAAPEEIPT